MSSPLLEVISPLRGDRGDYDALVEAAGEATYVLLGEATHGTHEFYRARALITARLIVEKGFSAVAVEADWPDAYRAGQYASGRGVDPSADSALSGFARFPTWMWRNRPTLEFLEWLRRFNASSGRPPAGFFGLDLYSLYTSADEVVRFLQRVDPEAARRAKVRYACLDHADRDAQAYAHATRRDAHASCEEEVVSELRDLLQRAARYQEAKGAEALFHAEQNARLVVRAEEYYRTMFRGEVSSWNLRDEHMADTLFALVRHLARRIERPKVVVWAHNSHLGDARATQMARAGEWNLGQLVRERAAAPSFLLGFTTFHGTVTAARDWDEPAERLRIRAALPGSYEALFHGLGVSDFYLDLRDPGAAEEALRGPRLERAIGVVYRPRTERYSHYLECELPAQFDAVIHFDRTRALEPLERTARWESGEAPETFPSAL